MIRIGILGDIGSGKSYVAREFGYPVFDADYEVSKIYKKDKKIFKKLNKKLPKNIYSFPIDKRQVTDAILKKKSNLKLIIEIIHKEIKKKFKLFLIKNKNKKIIIMDIPLLLENRINNKKDILIFVDSKKSDIEKRLKKEKILTRNYSIILKKFNSRLDIRKENRILLSKIILPKIKLK